MFRKNDPPLEDRALESFFVILIQARAFHIEEKYSCRKPTDQLIRK